MTVHSNQLGASDAVGGAQVTLYTVPSSVRTILKSIVCVNLDSAARLMVFSLKRSGVEYASFNVYLHASASDGDTAFVAPWIVMLPGDVLLAQMTGGTGHVVVSGSELTL